MEKKDKRLYYKWRCIKTRCNNPNNRLYKNYGAKGIKVCEQWAESFKEFEKWAKSNGWKPGFKIWRLVKTGDYEPANCRIYNPNKPEKPISKTELLASLYKKEYALFHKILKEHDSSKKSEMEKEQRILLERIAGLTGIDVNPDWDNFQLTMMIYATD